MLVHKTFFNYGYFFYFKDFKLTSIFFKKYTYNLSLLKFLNLFNTNANDVLFKVTSGIKKVNILCKSELITHRIKELSEYKVSLTSFTGNFYKITNQYHYNFTYKNFFNNNISPHHKYFSKMYLKDMTALAKKNYTPRPNPFFNIITYSKQRRVVIRIVPKRKINKFRTIVLLKKRGFFFRNFVVFTTRYLLFREKGFYYISRKIFKLAKRSKRLRPKHKTLPLIINYNRYRSGINFNKIKLYKSKFNLYYPNTNMFRVGSLKLNKKTVPAGKDIKNYKYLNLLTIHGGNYILTDYGIIIQRNNANISSPLNLYKIRKKLNSFLEINEYRQYIFNRRRLRFLKKLTMSTNISPLTNYSRLPLLYYKHLYSTGLHLCQSQYINSENFDTSELKISRVRFKPGYQRLWRNFRLAFAESINYRYTYQQQLTRYISKFFRKLNQTYLSQNENKISNILVYSKLVPDLKSFDLFFDNKIIYLNSNLLSTKLIYIYKNDLVQLEVSNWYYIFFRWVLNNTISREKRFKRLAYRKSSASRYTVMKLRKDKSYYIPKWIISTSYDYQDIKSFLEVDFFTLSTFMIYDYNNIVYYTPEDSRLIRYGVFRLYNWKYIT